MSDTSKEETKVKPIDVKEVGNSGLKHLNGVVIEECNQELRHPYATSTFKKMLKDPVVFPSVELIENKVASVPWRVEVPDGSGEYVKDKRVLIEQMLFRDMEIPFGTFVRQAATFNSFGFALHEKVFRFRNKEYGSRYDDGYVGIRKLAFRSQDSIARWDIDDKTQEVKGCYQYSSRGCNEFKSDYYSALSNGYTDVAFDSSNVKYISKKKLLHFVNNPYKDSPVGSSPLAAAYTPWKYKQAYLKTEAAGVSKESHGIKTLYLHPDYMDENASDAHKNAYKMYQQMMKNIDLGNSSSMILPVITDPMGNRMFELDVKNLTGSASYDINLILERLNNEIFTCLFANVLPLGSSGGGSHALSESKLDIVESMVKAKLDVIKSVINHDLIPHIFELNGWDTEELPFIEYGDINSKDLQAFGSVIQRIKAVGMLPVTPKSVNWVMEEIGCPERVPEDMEQEELKELLGDSESRSGDSFSTPTGGLNGTAKTVDTDDNTVSNKENK